MIRGLFKHDFTVQKDFENLHNSTIRTLNKVSKVESNPVWHKGDIEPSNAIGKSGDFYLDRVTGNVYTKDNGIWQL